MTLGPFSGLRIPDGLEKVTERRLSSFPPGLKLYFLQLVGLQMLWTTAPIIPEYRFCWLMLLGVVIQTAAGDPPTEQSWFEGATCIPVK